MVRPRAAPGLVRGDGPKELRGLSGLPGFAVVPAAEEDPDLAARYWEVVEDLADASFT